MSQLNLDAIRDCLEGYVPAKIATCDAEGIPNVSILSQVHYVDREHVALSYQFFNKTRRNVLATRRAHVQVVDPVTMAHYRLRLAYLETQTEGPLFETMKARLAGIAAYDGMEGVFRLLGSDLYRVLSIEKVPGLMLPAPPRRSLLAATRRCCARMSACTELSELFDATLAELRALFGIEHAMVLMADAAASHLYTVASIGYAHSGIGSEVAVGEGVIGVCAREGVPIRITHATSEYGYGRAVAESARRSGMSWASMTEIPFPGLQQPHSQVALPILGENSVAGVLFVESARAMTFWYDDEDALAVIASHLGAMMRALQNEEAAAPAAAAPDPAPEPARSLLVRHYQADDSIFLDHDYLIKGVAGAIFWKLAREHVQQGRTEFSNRELRLDPEIRLPEHAENLEARLVLLQRRLAERAGCVRIEKCGRGRFRLEVAMKLVLQDVAPGSESAARGANQPAARPRDGREMR
jgi:hypothetical protein